MTDNNVVIHHKKLVDTIVRIFKPHPNEIDDYTQVGYIGLINANRTWHDKSAKFETYASKCIKDAIISYIRGNTKSRVLNAPKILPIKDDWRIQDKYIDTSELMGRWYKSLNKIDRHILYLYFCEKRPLSNISVSLGHHKTWARKRLKRTITAAANA